MSEWTKAVIGFQYIFIIRLWDTLEDDQTLTKMFVNFNDAILSTRSKVQGMCTIFG